MLLKGSHSESSDHHMESLESQMGRKLPQLALASAALADETEFFKQRVTILAVGDQNLLALYNVARRGKGHHVAAAVPLVLRISLRVAGVVEVRCNGKDSFAVVEIEAVMKKKREPELVGNIHMGLRHVSSSLIPELTCSHSTASSTGQHCSGQSRVDYRRRVAPPRRVWSTCQPDG